MTLALLLAMAWADVAEGRPLPRAENGACPRPPVGVYRVRTETWAHDGERKPRRSREVREVRVAETPSFDPGGAGRYQRWGGTRTTSERWCAYEVTVDRNSLHVSDRFVLLSPVRWREAVQVTDEVESVSTYSVYELVEAAP